MGPTCIEEFRIQHLGSTETEGTLTASLGRTTRVLEEGKGMGNPCGRRMKELMMELGAGPGI